MRDRCPDEGGDDRRRGTHQHPLQAVGRWRSWHFRRPVGTAIVCADGISVAAGATTMTPAKHTPPRRWWPTPERRDRRRRVHDRHSDVYPNGRPGRHSRSRHRHHRTAATSTHKMSTNTSPPDPPHAIRAHLLRLGPEKQDQPPCSSITGKPNHPGAHPRAAPGMAGRTSHRRRVVVALSCRRHRSAALRTTADQNRGVEDHGDRAQPT